MRVLDCEREPDVLHAVTMGRWPVGGDQELRTHVSACPICQDIVDVATAFQRDAGEHADTVSNVEDASTSLRPQPRLPESSLVWLRAQIRAREDASRLAVRPITVAQAVAFASVVGVLGAVVGATSSWLQSGLHWLGSLITRADPRAFHLPDPVVVLLVDHGILIATIGACVMLTSVAVYLVTRET